MSRRKRQLPDRVAAQVKFASAYRCCRCMRQGSAIHHIDGNRDNNDLDNLAFLCHDCHHEAHIRGGLKRKLTPSDIRMCRDDWHAQVERNGREWVNSLPRDGSPFLAMDHLRGILLDAIAIDAIRAFEEKRQTTDWEQLKDDVQALFRYTDSRYSHTVHEEVLSAMASVTYFVSRGMPKEVVEAIKTNISAALPIYTLVGKQDNQNPSGVQLLLRGCDLGFELAYDALRYLKDLSTMDIGLELLREILRFAQLNALNDVREKALGEFTRLEEVARNHAPEIREDALVWICFKRDDALAVDDDKAPPLPWSVHDKIAAPNR